MRSPKALPGWVGFAAHVPVAVLIAIYGWHGAVAAAEGRPSEPSTSQTVAPPSQRAANRGVIVRARRKSEHRVALVIGNGAYERVPLANPASDARLMSQTLRAAGFDVIEGTDLSRHDMHKAVGRFARRVQAADVGLFYYAGHGLQIAGQNYLLPTDAMITQEYDVRVHGLTLSEVIAEMLRARTRVNIVILDACRNNPFESEFRAFSGGLAYVTAPTGTIVAYATAPGKLATDGDQEHSVYTRALAAGMQRRGVKIEDMFKAVRSQVLQHTGGQQQPWESTSLQTDFYFFPDPATAPAPAPGPTRIEYVNPPTPLPLYLSAAGAATALATAGVVGALAIHNMDRANSRCPDPRDGCSPRSVRLSKTATTYARVGNVSLLLGAVLTGVSVWLWLDDPFAGGEAGDLSLGFDYHTSGPVQLLLTGAFY